MFLWGESEVMVNTGQGKPTPLRGCSTRRPVERVEHTLIAALDVREIHGQVSDSGIKDCAESSPESRPRMVIEITPRITRAYSAPPRTMAIVNSAGCSTVVPSALTH
jgi:hypothetical protein